MYFVLDAFDDNKLFARRNDSKILNKLNKS